MKTVALPIENKVRELDGKLWLGLNFVERGYELVIGPSWEVKPTLDITKPDVYFAKDTGDGNIHFIKDLKRSGILACGLSPESAVNSEIEGYARHKSEIMDHLDLYFSWGDEPANAVRSIYDNLEETIKITGNPRFDLLTEDIRDVFSQPGNKIKREHGEFILINTNFTMGNPTDREKLFELIKRNHPDRDPIPEERLYSRILYSFLELITFLSSEDIGRKIILRPHPGEDHQTYKEAFKHNTNVEVKHEGEVHPWIYAADGVIHYDCTTGIEAALMETPVLSYQPLEDITNDNSLSQIVSKKARTRAEIIEWIEQSATGNGDYRINASQKTELQKYFPNINRLAASQICDSVDELANDTPGYNGYDINFQKKVETTIKASPVGDEIIKFYDLFRDGLTAGEHQRNRARQRQKFPGLEYEEVLNKCQILMEKLEIDTIEVERVHRTNYTHRIKS